MHAKPISPCRMGVPFNFDQTWTVQKKKLFFSIQFNIVVAKFCLGVVKESNGIVPYDNARGRTISVDFDNCSTIFSCSFLLLYTSFRYQSLIICIPIFAFFKLSPTPYADTKHTFSHESGRY